jgi:hypothetical protein
MLRNSSTAPTNVVRFRSPRSPASPRLDQRTLMDAVYSAGSLPIAADDRATKVMATRLSIFGFVVIDEVQADGSPRRLRPSEAVETSLARPWRVSKPSMPHTSREGVPDATAPALSLRPI